MAMITNFIEAGNWRGKRKELGDGRWVTVHGHPVFIKLKGEPSDVPKEIPPAGIRGKGLGHVKWEPKHSIQDTRHKSIESTYSIQQHLADIAGEHTDLRIKVGGQAESWSIPKGLPVDNKPRMAILQPPHATSYMNFSGDIPVGYGKGKVKLKDYRNIDIREWGAKKKSFTVYDGPQRGHYTLIHTNGRDWIIVRRDNYRKSISNQINPPTADLKFKPSMYIDQDYVAEDKLDGSRYNIYIGKDENRILSRQVSVKDNKHVERTDNIPFIRDMDLSKFDGTIIDGEVWHPDGFERVGSIMGSNPPKSRSKQVEYGSVRYRAFDISHYKGKYVGDLPYIERRKLLAKIINNTNDKRLDQSKLITNSRQLHSKLLNAGIPSQFSIKKEYYDKYVTQGGEGVMLKDINGLYNNKFMAKAKKTDTWDFVVTGFNKGEGKFANKYAIIRYGVINKKTGKIQELGKVHSGLTMNDIDFINNPSNRKKLLNGEWSIEVEGMNLTSNGAVRAPVFKRIRKDKGIREMR